MKLARVLAILAFVGLPMLRATPINLTATSLSFDCGGGVPCFYSVSGAGFHAQMEIADTEPSDYEVTLSLDGLKFYGPGVGSTLTVGNTMYGVSATGPTVISFMTSITNVHGLWSSSGPATATGEINVCSASVDTSGGTCDPALALAIINLPDLQGTFWQSWYDVAGNPANQTENAWGGSLSATPEPLSAGFAFAGLLFLATYRKWRSKAV